VSEKAAECSDILRPFSFPGSLSDIVFHVKHHSSALIYRTERLLNDTLSSVVANSTKTVLDVWPEGTRPTKAVLGNHIEAKPKVTEKGHHTTAEKYDSQAGPLVDSKTKEFNHLWQFNSIRASSRSGYLYDSATRLGGCSDPTKNKDCWQRMVSYQSFRIQSLNAICDSGLMW